MEIGARFLLFSRVSHSNRDGEPMGIASIMMWSGGALFVLGAGLRLFGGKDAGKSRPEKTARPAAPSAEEKLVDLAYKVVEKDIETTRATERSDLSISFEEMQRKLDEVLKRTGKPNEESIENGYKFEKFVVSKFKFNDKRFAIKGWEGDKYVKGMYSETTKEPDLKMALRAEGKEWPFAVECKWRSGFRKDKTLLFVKNQRQLKIYQDYQRRTGQKTFVVLGVGRPADNPEHLFIIPVEDLPTTNPTELRFTKKQLLPYYCHDKGKFAYDHKEEKLTTLPQSGNIF